MTQLLTLTRMIHGRISLRSIFHSLFKLDAAYRQRRQLQRLDGDQLKDIGLTKAEADRLADGREWNAPHHWMR